MKVFHTSQSLVEHLSKETRPIGMVPTMGALHLGHLSLIERALSENQTVLVSIFINPTQFDDKADLENYPIDFEADLRKIEQLPGRIFVYAPKVNDIYGNLVTSKSFDLGGLDQVMEGEKRSGHFQGVATVVSHLLKVFNPTNAYFGEKDFQQLRIIEHITESLKLKTKIIGCPIIREKDGLAMSSRNSQLSFSQRKLATVLRREHAADEVVYKLDLKSESKISAEATDKIKIADLGNPETHKTLLREYTGEETKDDEEER